jgi:signal transduction histidine kinase
VCEAYRAVYSDHALTLDIQPRTAAVRGAPDLIVQALDKLMDNAASFCPAGGSIELRLSAVIDGWEISISNSGPTLPAEFQDHLFDPMVSLRDNESSAVHLGLGLHIVRLIVDFHRGRVKAENLPGDQGVCVTMWFPRSDPSG